MSNNTPAAMTIHDVLAAQHEIRTKTGKIYRTVRLNPEDIAVLESHLAEREQVYDSPGPHIPTDAVMRLNGVDVFPDPNIPRGGHRFE